MTVLALTINGGTGRGISTLHFRMAETTTLTTWTEHAMPEEEFLAAQPVDAGGRPALAFISGEGPNSTLAFCARWMILVRNGPRRPRQSPRAP